MILGCGELCELPPFLCVLSKFRCQLRGAQAATLALATHNPGNKPSAYVTATKTPQISAHRTTESTTTNVRAASGSRLRAALNAVRSAIAQTVGLFRWLAFTMAQRA